MDNVPPRPGPLDAVYPEPVVRERPSASRFHHASSSEAAGKPANSAGELSLTTSDVDAFEHPRPPRATGFIARSGLPVGVVRYNVQWEMLLGKPLFVLGIPFGRDVRITR